MNKLNELSKQCYENALKKGFWEDKNNTGHYINSKLMLIVSELGEACEALRNDRAGIEKKDTFEDEIADTFIRLFDLCGALDIDIDKQIKWKMNYNSKRKSKHGKAF